MSEKRFKLSSETVLQYQIMDNDTDLNESEVVDLLNEQQATISYLEEANPRLQEQLGETLALVDEQQATIEQLQAKLKEKEEDEKLYANEIVELRKTNEEWLQFKELGGDY